MTLRFLFAAFVAAIMVTATHAQGLLLSQMQCQANYRGVPFQGVIQIQLFQYSGATGIGASGERSQLNLLIKTGRANEIPGTLYMIGEFIGAGVYVNIEAPNIVAGQGTGSIVVNGAAHRATYATFALVEGGVVAVTEDGERIEYICQ
ncbi:hypothetical protein [Marimonas arenosa]|uniref:Adhesin n=1 Tax=Marimonas arenosa TaxID=1795305 RepID=A0AAE4B5N8_9RHOB|nr:hypothetical protein [Marimonas arenosa]MDQ2091372.1 hypothetical protein [Marimonas arenosa]